MASKFWSRICVNKTNEMISHFDVNDIVYGNDEDIT